LTECGGIITKPSELKPLMHGEEYFGRANCTWIIKAPEGKSALVRFEKFVLEYSVGWVFGGHRASLIYFYRSSLLSICSCYFDNVGVYEGDLIVPDKRLGLICGNLTMHLPIFRSESNSMVVNFNADSSRHFEGFTAKVPSSVLSTAYNLILNNLTVLFIKIISTAFMRAIIMQSFLSSFTCQYSTKCDWRAW